jgi:ankyrin repeat protein
MFPNPHDALPLPPHPNLEQYKKRTKDLVKACHSSNPAAIRAWAARWVDSLVRLADLTITHQLPVRIDHWTDQLEKFAREKLSETCTLTAAQFVIARAQGFESWPQFANHLKATARVNSPVNHFELAADAIVTGDIAALKELLHQNPGLIRAQSTRRHHATLLHYISANGVEGYRQKTPINIVPIAQLLVQSGADVNASADIYGGSTTLDLVATSLHPERAGVQDALMQLLLDYGAKVDPLNQPAGGILTACLANGRFHAAEFLARRGAKLNLEAAAGLGRLDVVKSSFDENSNENGNLKPSATKAQMERALLWSCEYGQNAVARFLIQRGVPLETQADTGQTALHWAVIGAHLDTIKLLLDRGAPLEAKNSYGATPLGQALWSALHADGRIDYLPVIETLLKAGAKIEAATLAWLSQQNPSVSERIAAILKPYRDNI